MPRTTTPSGVDKGDSNTLTDIATIKNDIGYIKDSIKDIHTEQKLSAGLYLKLIEFDNYRKEVDKNFEEFKREYATKEYVKPALTFTYTVLGVLGTALLGALAAFIIRGGLQ